MLMQTTEETPLLGENSAAPQSELDPILFPAKQIDAILRGLNR